MTSLISVDQRLVALLPPKPRLRLNRLVANAVDLGASFRASIAQATQLREEIGLLRSEQRRAVDTARAFDDRPETHLAAAREFEPAIAELESELARLGTERARRDEAQREAAQLIAGLTRFLEQQSANPNVALVPADHAATKPADSNYKAAVEALRKEIADRERELAAVLRAPLPSGELRERAKAYVAELSKAGRPTLMAERGDFRIDWPPGAQMAMGTLGPGAACIMAALNPEAVLGLIEAEIAKVAGTGLSSNERPKREEQIRKRILVLEFHEESLIAQAEETGITIARRSRASPLAVLGIKAASAMAQAS
jgi:hypothetical protein